MIKEAFLLDNQLCFRLYTASRLLTQAYHPLLSEHGLTYPQYLVLLVLWEKDTQPVNDIAKRLYLETNTATPLIQRMEKEGLLTRNRGEKDARQMIVKLTKKGKQLQENLADVPFKVGGAVLCKSITPETVPGLFRMLDGMIAQLKDSANNLRQTETHEQLKAEAGQNSLCKERTLTFHPLSVSDREAVQKVTFHAGRRNCNLTFANLLGWQFWYHTEVCVLEDTVILRFIVDGERGYMVCTAKELSKELIETLLKDSHGQLTIHGLEDTQVTQMERDKWITEKEENRNQYDYIYRRAELATLHGGQLKAKRNHVNRFHTEHPDFEYRPLTPALFDECRHLATIWQEEKDTNENILAERCVMEKVFAHWEELGMIGGAVFIKEDSQSPYFNPPASGHRMVAFTYGAAVTADTFDVCVEKADRNVEGAFAIINQQFAEHLPEQYIYLNREEDMGLPGLRKAKLSYHPEILLSYNTIKVKRPHSSPITLKRMTAEDAPLTIDWMVRQYGFERSEAETWVRDLHFNWPLSVKALDADGTVVGMLNMSDYRIEEETPQIHADAPALLAELNARRYTAVFSFIVAEPYRGTRLNYDMLMSIMPELKARYDFLFIPVLHRLKTHRYWQRWGATEFYRDTECVYYKLELS